jgi:Zn-dependent protease
MKFAVMNIGLAVFNMIPLPPLDGFRIVQTFLPRIASVFMRNSQLISMLFFFILIVPRNPIKSLIINSIALISGEIAYWMTLGVSNIF